jgi:uncharacterized protein YdaU (DUF1376 family)
MYFYNFNIGDYASHTKGLSLLEDLAYRRLLDAYYLNERPFNGCSTDVARLIGMREHADDVGYVLDTFFTNRDGDWVHQRVEDDLLAYQSKSIKARKAGKASAKARKNKGLEQDPTGVQQTFNERSTDVQPTNNQEPITNNQIKKKAKRGFGVCELVGLGVDRGVAEDWMAVRKLKRAANTVTALQTIINESEKAGMNLNDVITLCAERSWQGFKAEWVREEKSKKTQEQDFVSVNTNTDWAKGIAE